MKLYSLATFSEAISSFIHFFLLSRGTFSVPPLPQMHKCPSALYSTFPPSTHLSLLSSIFPLPLPSGSATDPHKILSQPQEICCSLLDLCVHQFIAQLSALKLVFVCMQVRLNVLLHFSLCCLTPPIFLTSIHQ